MHLIRLIGNAAVGLWRALLYKISKHNPAVELMLNRSIGLSAYNSMEQQRLTRLSQPRGIWVALGLVFSS